MCLPYILNRFPRNTCVFLTFSIGSYAKHLFQSVFNKFLLKTFVFIRFLFFCFNRQLKPIRGGGCGQPKALLFKTLGFTMVLHTHPLETCVFIYFFVLLNHTCSKPVFSLSVFFYGFWQPSNIQIPKSTKSVLDLQIGCLLVTENKNRKLNQNTGFENV